MSLLIPVSQFTLHAVTAKGAKPDFHSTPHERAVILILSESMKGPEAKLLYTHVLDELGKGLPGGKTKVKGKLYSVVETESRDGVFGAMMQVDISNDVRLTIKG